LNTLAREREHRLPPFGAAGGWRTVRLAQLLPAKMGLARMQQVADEIAHEAAVPALLIWRSQRALLVTRQDTRLPGFHESAAQMASVGWPVVARRSGGGACPVGPGTLELATVEPALAGATMNAKYEALSALIQAALHGFGIAARSGPVASAYCRGNYDLAVAGRKIAGLSQHWFRNRNDIRCVVTAASVNVAETSDALAAAVNRFYGAAGGRSRCRAACLTGLWYCCSNTAAAADLVRDLGGRLAALAGGG
jgi:hypothetical protein